MPIWRASIVRNLEFTLHNPVSSSYKILLCQFSLRDSTWFVLAPSPPHLPPPLRPSCTTSPKVGCYNEIYRVLKTGQCFAAYEWCITDAFDPNNQEHQKIKVEIELGNGLLNVRLIWQCLVAVKQAGFEVVWEKDLAADSPLPWYLPLDKSHFSLNSFRLTAIDVMALEKMGLALKGSQRVQAFLEKAAEGLVAGGE
ncbi:unnamed protein product [Fraxinus pennsylvanica]|uniref:SAM-dependent methyltransferase Erg6/SMT-type domain-containing protein n=1 Tax=Fraxinus pennsylvanica TaxID=56036 RepID=A0AAD1ZU65_9LAMI|nr:unnamed protein product [Fraxinus pennsylvanica]